MTPERAISERNKQLLNVSQELASSCEQLAEYNKMLRSEAAAIRDHAKQSYTHTARYFDDPAYE